MKTRIIFTALWLACCITRLAAQPCTPAGDETTYGTSDTWIGYVYDNINFTSYAGYVNEGGAGNMNFDRNFGGDNVNYSTNGCAVYTETFSVRYKLFKTFTDGDYQFTIGGDDGFRLSIDGGVTWLVNQFVDQGYTITTATVHLNGAYNLVLEYYENGGANRISFNMAPVCLGTDDPSVYGTGNVWRGYVYDGTNFSTFKGTVPEGSAASAYFDESFGGDNVLYNTNACSITTETFSVRYRLRKTFPNTSCIFLVGGDDGYRLSLDGGATWVINQWNDHGYNTTSYTATLNGTYDMVLEYYENGGGNRVSFDVSYSVLPIELLQFSGTVNDKKALLNWTTSLNSNTDHFTIQRSADGTSFNNAGQVAATEGAAVADGKTYTYTDPLPVDRTTYYRLQMTDQTGTVSYSKIITIKTANTGSLTLLPTLVNGNSPLMLKSDRQINNITLTITDMQGRILAQQHRPVLYSNQALPMDITPYRLSKGMYVVQVRTPRAILLHQIIVVQ